MSNQQPSTKPDQLQSGTVPSYADIRAEGWHPLHWTDITTPNQIRYRVVMERDESGGQREYESTLRA